MTVRGPTFVRLLARLTDVDLPLSSPALSDRLSQWLDWTHAIALSTALDGKPSAAGPDAPASGSAEEHECARVRASLANAIVGDPESPQPPRQAAGTEAGAAEAAVDYAAFRQRYLAMQRAMQAATGDLRGRLRDRLARQSAELARLAEVDAAMELALSPREQRLLAAVPALLGARFEHLRQEAAGQMPDEPPAAASGAWLEAFRRDMQSVLLAELDVRFLPVEGLLAALRTC